MEQEDLAEAQQVLRDLITKIEDGELEAPTLLLARLTGALDALNALRRSTERLGEAAHGRDSAGD
jgi:predicted transcriptional regulator